MLVCREELRERERVATVRVDVECGGEPLTLSAGSELAAELPDEHDEWRFAGGDSLFLSERMAAMCSSCASRIAAIHMLLALDVAAYKENEHCGECTSKRCRSGSGARPTLAERSGMLVEIGRPVGGAAASS